MAVKGNIRPLHDKVLVADMNFGEQQTSTGIVILSDNGKDSGIHPRWAQVYAVGPDHKEEFNVGDWILIEHGRWTRGIDIEESNGEKKTIRLVDNNCVIMWDNTAPNDVIIGNLSGGEAPPSIRPEEFM
jgi:co-chaperonin GroES (HSP10)